MNLDELDLSTVFAKVFVERDETRLVGLDEFDRLCPRSLSPSSLRFLILLVALKMKGLGI
jgi:hypothetical protein